MFPRSRFTSRAGNMMQNSTFLAEDGIRPEWGRKRRRSGDTTSNARNMTNLFELKENSKAKEIVGWISPTEDWKLWVEKLSSVHSSTWKNAGIYEAIMSSIYKINRHDELILELISIWCSKTKTFVFPWGDATLTLEDMLVLGGFSVSGLSILSCVEDDDSESVKIKEQLEAVGNEILSSKGRSRQAKWMKKFIGSGHELEHAAFLSVWLSKFVFAAGSFTNFMVHKDVFPLAARLSRGTKIALGPVVLATLYAKLTSFTKIRSGENSGLFDFRAPLYLVQIWAWERLPIVNCLHSTDVLPRMARWSNVKIPKRETLKFVMDYCGKRFLWCPYGESSVCAETDFETFALCMKACEIVGFDSCVEKYQPQYVTRQFGYGQMNTTTVNPVESRTRKVENKNLFGRASTSLPTITEGCEKCGNKRRELRVSQVKVESEVEYGPPPGFPAKPKHLRVVDLVDRSNDEGIAIEAVNEVEGGANAEGVEVEVLSGSVRETRKMEVQGSSNGEGVAMEAENGPVYEAQVVEDEVDSGSRTCGRSMGSVSELEARIKRLEDIFRRRERAMEGDK